MKKTCLALKLSCKHDLLTRTTTSIILTLFYNTDIMQCHTQIFVKPAAYNNNFYTNIYTGYNYIELCALDLHGVRITEVEYIGHFLVQPLTMIQLR